MVQGKDYQHNAGDIMEIKGKAHCLFEQSGTFKNEFIRLGIPAEDYDIQNNFGQTDHVIDIFHEIEEAYRGGQSIFDSMSCDDIIMAFFPCIYFTCMSQMLISWTHRNYRNLTPMQKGDAILQRSANRERFFRLAVMLHTVCYDRGLRMIMENPWSEQTFLKTNFISNPSLVDSNRLLRGDRFIKPTAYWYVNCEPTHGYTIQPAPKGKNICQIEPNHMPGICNEERSMISPDYARNFICDFILGKAQPEISPTLFD